MYYTAFCIIGPKGFVFSAAVIMDDLVGGSQNIFGGAVVLLQFNDSGSRVFLFKV